jgi:cytochrome c556
MRRTIVAAIVVLAGVGGSLADDPIHARKELMEANGKATKAVVAIMKGASPFKLETVQAALNTYIAAAEKGPALFPVGSEKGGKTEALPAIWQNKSDFEARFAKLGEDSKAALAAIKDQASFKTSFPPVLKDCNGCHETYRAKD